MKSEVILMTYYKLSSSFYIRVIETSIPAVWCVLESSLPPILWETQSILALLE